jgi:hypothetical protein
VILYHFTDMDSWADIYREGVIQTTESNIGDPTQGPHFGPRVVWLTNMETPDAVALGLDYPPAIRRMLRADGHVGPFPDKREMRFTVELEDAEPWATFSARHGMNRKWRRTFERGKRPDTWFVVARPIPMSEVSAMHRFRWGPSEYDADDAVAPADPEGIPL